MPEGIEGLDDLKDEDKLIRICDELSLRIISEKPFSDILLQIINYGIGVTFMSSADPMYNRMVNLKMRVWKGDFLERIYVDRQIHPEVVGQLNF